MQVIPVGTRPRSRRSLRRLAALAALATVGTVVATTAPPISAAGTVSGTVYRDSNNNGVRDAGESGVAGIVVTGGATSALTNANGAWSIAGTGNVAIRVVTGWYRTQCNAASCAAGPGAGQDFAVNNQMIVTTVNADSNPVVDVGVVPDWPGGYPIPGARPVPANNVDVSSRVSFVAPAGGQGSNCFRTSTPANRACAIGDQPSFLAQVYNEGTTAITNPGGYLELPPGTNFVSMIPAVSPANHPAVSSVSLGTFDNQSRRLPFTMNGTLPAGGAAMYTVTLLVRPDAPITTEFQTKGSYPNPIGIRVTSVVGDAEGDGCAPNAASCAYGQTNKQASPDNSDTVGFAIVAAAGSGTTATTAPATTAPPVTSAPAVISAPPTTQGPVITAAATGGCTVSNLLVPSCGAWLGASTAAKSGKLGSADYVIGLNEYEAVAANQPDILHFYKSGSQRFPNQTEISMANRPGKQRSLLFYNWKPTAGTWRDVARGSSDSQIATVAAGLKAYPNKVFLTIWHEPEDQVGGTGRSAADYAAMFRYVVTKLRSLGVTNAVFVMNYMGFNGWSHLVDGLWPGNDVVDWIAYDPYGFKMHSNFGLFLDTPKSGWPGFYSWATKKAPGKPIMLGEWGFDLNKQPDSPAILDAAVPIIQRDFPMLKALVYWHDHADNFSVRIDQNTTLGRAYGQAYKRFANHAYFNQTATSGAP